MFGQEEQKASGELRNKNWVDLTDLEKIERQRDIIKNLERSSGFMQERLTRLEQNFNQHQHSDKGLMVPLHVSGLIGNVSSGLAKLANPDYF